MPYFKPNLKSTRGFSIVI